MKIRLDVIESSINKIDDTPPTVTGEVLNFRGESYDLSQLPNGAEVEADLPFTDKIKRSVDGELSASLQYFYTTQTAEPMQSTNWDDYTFMIENGECPCPIKRKPDSEIKLRNYLSSEGSMVFEVNSETTKRIVSTDLNALKGTIKFDYAVIGMEFSVSGSNASLLVLKDELAKLYGELS